MPTRSLRALIGFSHEQVPAQHACETQLRGIVDPVEIARGSQTATLAPFASARLRALYRILPQRIYHKRTSRTYVAKAGPMVLDRTCFSGASRIFPEALCCQAAWPSEPPNLRANCTRIHSLRKPIITSPLKCISWVPDSALKATAADC